MFEVMIEESFSAAHRLLDYDGDEEQIHGHTWKVRIYVSGQYVDTSGILIDFKVLTSELKDILDKLDHKNLNTVEPFKTISPSSELIAQYVYKQLKPKYNKISRVTVCESEKARASYWE